MAKGQFIITASTRVSANRQRIIRQNAPGLIGNIVVVRTLFGTFIGCLLSVQLNAIRLRIFSGINRRFIVIRIPIGIILDIFRFPC